MKILLICFCALLGGCAGYSYTHGHVNGVGVYTLNGVPVTGNVSVDTYSCIGKCPAIPNIEAVNATNKLPTNN